MKPDLHISGIVDVDLVILRSLPPVLAPLLRNVCSAWASAVPREGFAPKDEDFCYRPEELCSYLARQCFFKSLRWASCCGAPWAHAAPILSHIISRGSMGCLKWALDQHKALACIDKHDISDLCNTVAREGRPHVLDWFLKRKELSRQMIQSISACGSASTIRWALAHRVVCSSKAYAPAAEANDVNLLEALFKQGARLTARYRDKHWGGRRPDCAAASKGSLEALQWLHTKSARSIRPTETTSSAIAGGHVHVLMWLNENGLLDKMSPCVSAAYHGRKDIISWLHHGNACPWDDRVTKAAVDGGHFELFLWLFSQGCDYDLREIMESAIAGGHIGTAEWALHRGASWSDEGIEDAIRKGDLETLRWCRANGAPWDGDPCVVASDAGQVDVLRWLISDEGGAGHHLRPSCVARAMYRGHLGMLKVLLKANCELEVKEIAHALRAGDLDTVSFLHTKGYLTSDTVFKPSLFVYITSKQLVVRKWLLARGLTRTAAFYNEATTKAECELEVGSRQDT